MASAFTDVYRKLLRCLRKARKEAGLTQVQVARLLEKPQSFVSEAESGERRVDVIELKHFAQIYSKPIDFFL